MIIFKAQRQHGGAAFYAFTFTAAADYVIFHLLAGSRPVPWIVTRGKVPRLTREERRLLEQGGSVHIAPPLDDEKPYCAFTAEDGDILMEFEKKGSGRRLWRR